MYILPTKWKHTCTEHLTQSPIFAKISSGDKLKKYVLYKILCF